VPGGVDVATPLFQAFDFEGNVEVLLVFGFDDPVSMIRSSDDEVRLVARYVAVCLDIVDAEVDGEIVFCLGEHVRTAFEK
jgi:hypothetical protein